MEYLSVLIDTVEKNSVNSIKLKSIKKSENKIVKILAKSKDKIYLSLDLEICLSLKKFKILLL